MGATHGKPKLKRRATINLTPHKQLENRSPNSNRRMSWNESKHEKTFDTEINIMSPMAANMPKASYSTTDLKNRGKISISTYHPTNNTNEIINTPPSAYQQQRRARANTDNNHLLISPKRSSILSSASVFSSRLLSPLNNKSRRSLSTASPRRAGRGKNVQTDRLDLRGNEYNKVRSQQQHRASLDINEIVVAGRFRLVKKLGKGSFGVAYEALDLLSNKSIAIKLERKREETSSEKTGAASLSTSAREIIILEKLERCHRVPTLIWHGQYKQYRVMALELQGLNLSDLYEKCGCNFSLKTAIYLMIECIYCLQDIHSKGVVHRDIKPQNFIISRDLMASNKIHIIDFGLSSWFMNSVGEHIAYNDSCSPVGTARYASIHNHRGVHQTRRDDLESVGYMIVFFLKKELPWQGLREPGRVRKWRKIQQRKESTANSDLTNGLPIEFCFYLDYVKKLKYDEQPDYAKLIRVFKTLYVKQGYYAQDMQRIHGSQLFDASKAYDGDYSFNVAEIIEPDWRSLSNATN